MTFRVGQKVVCINDEPLLGRVWRSGDRPRLGGEYTIAGAAINDDGDYVVQLIEKKRRCPEIKINPWYAWYGAHRFRPVIERKTDISIFTEILDRVNKRERVSIHD